MGSSKVKKAFSEAHRVLRPGGILVSLWMIHSESNLRGYMKLKNGKSSSPEWDVLHLGAHEKHPRTLVLVAQRRNGDNMAGGAASRGRA